ncbi:MAG: hypothetical protein HY327_00645 [Chloroflexi bacterium]|nr:hypothetical protein [Chloroflexota bacterium]
MFEYPRTLDSNRYCVLCGDCLHACLHDSPQMIWRAPASELAEIRKPVFAEAVFVILLLGLVIAEVVRMTPLYPALMERALLTTNVDNYALVYTLLFAALLSGLVGLALLAARTATRDWRAALSRFAYAFVPLGLGAHVGVNFFELAAEGTRSIQTVIDNLRVPLTLFDLPPKVRGSIYSSDPVLMLWQFAALALGLIATLWLIRRIARQTQTRALPLATFAVFVAAAFAALYALPMKPGC